MDLIFFEPSSLESLFWRERVYQLDAGQFIEKKNYRIKQQKDKIEWIKHKKSTTPRDS